MSTSSEQLIIRRAELASIKEEQAELRKRMAALVVRRNRLRKSIRHMEQRAAGIAASPDIRQKRSNNASRLSAEEHCCRWTDEEEQYIIANHDKMTRPAMARHLKRTILAVKGKIHLLRELGKLNKSC